MWFKSKTVTTVSDIAASKEEQPEGTISGVFIENSSNYRFPIVDLGFACKKNNQRNLLQFFINDEGIVTFHRYVLAIIDKDNIIFCRKHTDSGEGFILADAQFDKIEEIKEAFLKDGIFLTPKAKENIQQEASVSKRAEESKDKFQVLLNWLDGGQWHTHTSDYVDLDTANSWLDYVKAAKDNGRDLTVKKVKEGTITHLNTSTLHEYEVIDCNFYLNRTEFYPYWRL